jgi:predicted negative regulator of RcsB-dependent stress response
MNMIYSHFKYLSLFFFIALLVSNPAAAKGKYFHYSPDARTAYLKATQLRFGEAYGLLAQIRLRDPDNLIVHHIENYIDFFKLYISEEKAIYDQLKDKRDWRLDKIKNSGDPSSPYYLFIQADIRLQWALARLRFEDYLGAFAEVSKAHRLLKENQDRFPDFMPNKKDLGILHAMVGTIPDGYKWGVKLLGGLEGTIEEGKREIEQVLAYAKRKGDFIFEEETSVLYAFLLLHLANDKQGAWQAISSAGLTPTVNPLHCFVMANIAMRTGQNEAAIQLLQQQPQGRAYYPFPYLDYMLGLAKLRRLDKDAAPNFQQYLKTYNGRNFIKEAYQKLAWQALINGDVAGYHRHMKQCLTEGADEAGGDKHALNEAQAGVAPNLHLLKARLLFDGGYYHKGYNLLMRQSANNFRDEHELEYHYRLGRLLHGMERYNEAIQRYEKTIALGTDSPRFFACNAALKIGNIYETLGQHPQARRAYERCMDIKPDEYRVSLHQKAKSGLARLR